MNPEMRETGGHGGFFQGGLASAALFFAVYFALSIAVRMALPDSLTLDEAEQALFSQYWRLGYGPQPPFYNWVQNGVVAVFGLSLFSLALPKFAMLLLAYVFYGLTAREIAGRHGFTLMAVMSLATLPQVSYMPQQDLTHSTALLMASALFLYGVARALKRGDAIGYALIGLAAGIGTISKYNFVLLPAATLLAVWLAPQWRRRLLDRRMLVAAAIGLAIVAPHAVWLAGNIGPATAGTLGKMAETDAPQGLARILAAIGSLLMACLAFGALTVAVFGLAFRGHFAAALRAGDDWTRLLGRMMVFSLAGVVVLICVTGTTRIVERWLDPYLLALPLWLLLKLELAGADPGRHVRRLLPVFATILLLSLAAPAAIWASSGLTGAKTRLDLPYGPMAAALERGGQPALILADGMHLAGNMRLQFPKVPVIDTRRSGGEVLHAGEGEVLAVWEQNAGDLAIPAAIDLPALEEIGYRACALQSLSRPYHVDRSRILTLGTLRLRKDGACG